MDARTLQERREQARKPTCKLTGTDGNVFAIIGAVKQALKQAHQYQDSIRWCREAMASRSYDDVLALAFKYVEVV